MDRTAHRLPSCRSSVIVSGAMSSRQNAESGPPSACRIKARMTAAWVIATACFPAVFTRSSHAAVLSDRSARLSPPWPRKLASLIQPARPPGSRAATSATGVPAQRPQSRSASSGASSGLRPNSAAVWRHAVAGLLWQARPAHGCGAVRLASAVSKASSRANLACRVAGVGPCDRSSKMTVISSWFPLSPGDLD